MLEFTSYGRADLRRPGHARALLGYIARHPGFIPDCCGSTEPFRPFDLEAAIAALLAGAESDAFGDVFLERRRCPKYLFHLMWYHNDAPFHVSGYSIEEKWIASSARLEEWLTFCFSLLPLHETWYGHWALTRETEAKQKLTWRAPQGARGHRRGSVLESLFGGELAKGIPGVFWGNYFGPFYVNWYGREKIQSLPCVEKRDLPDGGIFFTTAPTPFDWDKPEWRRLQRQVMVHLGADTFFDMDAFRERVRRELGSPGIDDPAQLLPKCCVPEFPFPTQPRQRGAATPEERRAEAIRFQESMGLRLVAEPEAGVLVFEGPRGERVEIDVNRRTVKHWPAG